ncbi:glutamyl-tRNA reductase [Desulfolutivibrio sulfoxidireducens]|uniref:glutamyl-tRNA reductase n=1 Tax=Desulfolutivibrio sulfoxidireducens TaxID=2773299 RepID=UPI00159D85AC|nr:glutamyl-tRNA reductase [Desulfolutivibrio sulfoxidireducens]QLA16190.1 glutamyl-tRNA reductase [Desulfolutivibrio sulfoxidireducens]
MQDNIHLFGLNHKTADVEVREAFALADGGILERALLSRDGPIREALVLSTCNRVEILVSGAPGTDPGPMVLSRWAGHCNRDGARLAPHIYAHSGRDAVEHVFRVASGLDSMVLGEPQILGQMKDAYRRAVESGSTGVILNRLLHKAFSTAKKVRTATGIGASAVSISYAAVELAKRIFGETAGKKAMLIGAGEMAELAATHLLTAGISHLFVANRTLSRAQELAERFKGTAIPFEDLAGRLVEADIIISSTGAPQAIIRAKDIRDVLKKRRQRPMFFIDIAVPRDIDPDVNSLDNVYLYDIDDLREVVEENLAQRKEEATRAGEIVREQVESFSHWLKALDLSPTIVDVLRHGEDIAHRELCKTIRRLGPDVTPETAKALERLAVSISHKILHEPIVFLKRRSRENAGERFIDLIRRIFDLDREVIPEDAHSRDEAPAECDHEETISNKASAPCVPTSSRN